MIGEVRAALAAYDPSAAVVIRDVRVHSGSGNSVAVFDGRVGERSGRFALRRYDPSSETFSAAQLALELGIHAHAAEHGLPTDRPLPGAAGASLFEHDGRLYSLREGLPGEALRWERWAEVQAWPGVPERLGELQAAWDRELGPLSPQQILARLGEDDRRLLGGSAKVEAAVRQELVEQTVLSPRLDLASGETNLARLERADFAVDELRAWFPEYARLWDRWLPRLRELFHSYEEDARRVASEAPVWLQHGDPSPTNTFFLPQVDGWKAIDGIVDFELARYAAYRSDLGVAASMRFGDTPDRGAVEAVGRGEWPDGSLELGDLAAYLSGYFIALGEPDAPITAEELAVGLRANVLGLVLWSTRMARTGLTPPDELARYLATQLHRAALRWNTDLSELERALEEAHVAAIA